jgi:hypothetical protein
MRIADAPKQLASQMRKLARDLVSVKGADAGMGHPLSVLHLPIEIAGQIGTICGALQERGHFARGFNFFTTYLDYKDFLLNTDAFEMGRMFEDAARRFDLFHYHYGLSVFPRFRDLELLRSIGKPIVMHHWGSDVRMASVVGSRNPYVYTADSPPEDEIRGSLQTLGRYVSDAIVQDHEVLPYVKPYYRRVHVVPLAIDLARFPVQYPSETEANPLILHAPTNKEFKGTADVERAISELQGLYPFRYVRIENMSHEEAVRMYRDADIVIDQVRCGSYGLFSVEAMAYGKPVIAYIRPDLAETFGPRLPIVSANPDTLRDALEGLLRSPGKRRQLGIAGRKYAEERHDSRKVAEQLLGVYRLAMRDA